MTDVFNPSEHLIVAVDKDGQHLHVTASELAGDLASVRSERVPNSSTGGSLALAVSLAAHAIMSGVQAGDYLWHGGETDFEWAGTRMDAPELIEFARSQLSA